MLEDTSLTPERFTRGKGVGENHCRIVIRTAGAVLRGQYVFSKSWPPLSEVSSTPTMATW
jgi:hypothetical protein